MNSNLKACIMLYFTFCVDGGFPKVILPTVCDSVLISCPFTVPSSSSTRPVNQHTSLSVTSHINCVVARCLIHVVYLRACAFIRSWCHCTIFKWRRQWHWIDTIIENYVIIAIMKSETIGKLINRIPGSCLLISSLPGLALRMHVGSLNKPHDFNKHSQSLAW